MITIPLKKPITAHAEELRSITLREPTAEDVMAEGFPTLMVPSSDGKSVAVDIRANVVGHYISRLGGIPMASVKTLSLPDLHERGDEFFREWRGRDHGQFSDRVFDVAYFWRLNPKDVLCLPLDRFALYERQAERIAEQMNKPPEYSWPNPGHSKPSFPSTRKAC